VATVSEAEPDAWSREEQLAFYINAYNALTVDAVLDRWPITSVMRVRGFFDRILHMVAGREMTLNQLEGDIIRARFRDPRIHFVVNCASVSCPPLAREAYTAANLESALETQTRTFLRASTTLDRQRRRATVTKLFEWYRDDWGGVDGVRNFLAERLEEGDAAFVRDPGTRLVYADYDWDLNDRE
jgi:hypothetical protein